MRTEFVERRQWLDDAEFVDLIAVSNLIPGPNSTEIAIHLGYRRAGLPGLAVAGLCFILPAATLVLGLAALYVRFGSLPDARAALSGAKPVILAVVAHALFSLSRSVLKNAAASIIAALALAAALAGLSELLVVFVPGLILGLNRWRTKPTFRGLLPIAGIAAAVGAFLGLSVLVSGPAQHHQIPGAWPLFLEFLKVGSVLYGSGYVLLSYLEADVVRQLAWLSPNQLLDAVAVGQFTPGPLFTTATFVGYVAAGVPGAVAATVGIFLPSFFFVLIGAKALHRLKSDPMVIAFMVGVSAASLGLMGSVLWKLGNDAIGGIFPATVSLLSLAILVKTKWNSAWLVLAGAVLGLATSHLGGIQG